MKRGASGKGSSSIPNSSLHATQKSSYNAQDIRRNSKTKNADHIVEYQMIRDACVKSGYKEGKAKEVAAIFNNSCNLQNINRVENQNKGLVVGKFLSGENIPKQDKGIIKDMRHKYYTEVRPNVCQEMRSKHKEALSNMDVMMQKPV